MSRHAKARGRNFRTTQPSKPNQFSHYYEFKQQKNRQSKLDLPDPDFRKLSCRSTGIPEEDTPRSSRRKSILTGVSTWAGELYKSLSSSESALLFLYQESVLKRAVSGSKTPERPYTFNSFSNGQSLMGPRLNRTFSPKINNSDGLEELVSLNPEAMAPKEHIERIAEFGQFSDEVVLLAAIYLQRALLQERELKQEHFHKLVAGCILVDFKFLNDSTYWGFHDFAFLCGFEADQIEKIEQCVLVHILKFRLYVSEEEYRYARRKVCLEKF